MKTRESFGCPFCWRVVRSKAALTAHLNREHWDEQHKCPDCGKKTDDRESVIECDECLAKSLERAS